MEEYRRLCRWEDNIRKDLKEISINTRNWVDLVQDRGLLESPCECGIEPPGSISLELVNIYFQKRMHIAFRISSMKQGATNRNRLWEEDNAHLLYLRHVIIINLTQLKLYSFQNPVNNSRKNLKHSLKLNTKNSHLRRSAYVHIHL